MSKSDTEVLDKVKNKDNDLKPPSKFKVVIFNDDVTPVDFVVSILMLIFNHSQEAATELTLTVHNANSATAGVYTFEIAEQKTIEATTIAKANGYPLIIKVEPT